ncbi:hypothetical protein [Streptomyces avermitilis]|uniref:hypothetical protein n=1 Tax=Streptomyces avermitilis TaxID=33903 RepID=UPI00339F9207
MPQPHGNHDAGHELMWELVEARRALSQALEQQQTRNAPAADPVLNAAARRLLKATGEITTRMATQSANRGLLHWAVTISGLAGGRQTLASDHGVLRPAADHTRQTLREQLMRNVAEQAEQRTGERLTDVRLLHFDLQPNELPAPN